MKRRSVLKYAITSAALLATAILPYGLSRILQPEERRALKRNAAITHRKIRPPGALPDDKEFISACIGCGVCGEVCPPQCIQFYKADGGDNANTPYIAPAEKACTLCDKCMEVCPTNALTETPKEEIEMGTALIDEDACYPWIDNGICGACVVICPLGDKAISFDFANIYRPVIQDGCVGCGLCVEVCPHPSLPIRIT